MKICVCGSEVIEDESTHVEPERETHQPSGVVEVPFTRAEPEE